MPLFVPVFLFVLLDHYIAFLRIKNLTFSNQPILESVYYIVYKRSTFEFFECCFFVLFFPPFEVFVLFL